MRQWKFGVRGVPLCQDKKETFLGWKSTPCSRENLKEAILNERTSEMALRKTFCLPLHRDRLNSAEIEVMDLSSPFDLKEKQENVFNLVRRRDDNPPDPKIPSRPRERRKIWFHPDDIHPEQPS